MNIFDLIKLSTRMFKARTTRTLLTILGMGVGIGAILFLVGLGYGIQKTLLETITTADSLLALDVYPGDSRTAISSDDVDKIKSLDGVESISPVFETMGQLKYNNLVSDSKVLAVDKDFIKLDGIKIVEGYDINNNEPDGVVITDSLAKVFEKQPQEMLGSNLMLYLPEKGEKAGNKSEMNFKIIGFTEKKDILIYMNAQVLDSNVSSGEYTRLKVKCNSSAVLPAVREKLTGEGFIVSALTDLIRQVDQAFGVIRIILGFFGAIALMVSAIGMFNTMTVALLERTEEIGIMKSIGASNYDILWMFVFESTIMGFLGGLSGLVIGFVGGEIFNFLVNFLAQRLGGNAASLLYFPGWFLIFILAVATLVGFFTGLIPARKASATDPLEALRYK
ncbi:MAG: ABC transporter permease [Candidatus Moranbacteria bacterium]|nr:ABC transporter permease [Candidatus Moranbacteria bacterium]